MLWEKRERFSIKFTFLWRPCSKTKDNRSKEFCSWRKLQIKTESQRIDICWMQIKSIKKIQLIFKINTKVWMKKFKKIKSFLNSLKRETTRTKSLKLLISKLQNWVIKSTNLNAHKKWRIVKWNSLRCYNKNLNCDYRVSW